MKIGDNMPIINQIENKNKSNEFEGKEELVWICANCQKKFNNNEIEKTSFCSACGCAIFNVEIWSI